MIPIEYYFVISTLMLFIGVYGFITRPNMLAMLMSLELILNAVNINFAVFNRYLYADQLEGMFFSLFSIGIAAAETAVAIAIIINVFRHEKKIETNEVKNLKY
ncbi:MAG: NADH-quinone oxidoreductase subunit NuoK [Prevotellaceae bacterium]|jgi:NADH-quinone oxidoreductase subunit K|nr:NADH-quinone oxidoreductase subunit NuoK [Prevotellaceae bacterium]